MLPTPLNTPGVYVQEVSMLPPSVAQVATAIPAFVGYTSSNPGDDRPFEIATLLDYEQRFGKPASPADIKVTVNSGGELAVAAPGFVPGLLWYAVKLYFDNGGGRCFIVPVGLDTSTAQATDFEQGLTALEGVDEPTLVLAPQAVSLDDTGHATVTTKLLSHCKKMADRFAILDVRMGDQTTEVAAGPAAADDTTDTSSPDTTAPVAASTPAQPRTNKENGSKFRSEVSGDLDYGAAYYPYLSTAIPYQIDESKVTVIGKFGQSASTTEAKLDTLKTKNTEVYNKIKRSLASLYVTLPPSPAIAGAYVRTDRERGVWKAPANVALASVIGPVRLITEDENGDLNVDATSGKSINAIRAFTGRGTLVWGARTLLGNDNEWRYVPVRRLFITVEESAKKASSFAVFEPNTVLTWLKVKGMLDAYLYSLWEQGALQGSKAEQAFYVSVGLGKTMSPQDVLEGRMIVEIGLAAVRPAEFVVLRFSHLVAGS